MVYRQPNEAACPSGETQGGLVIWLWQKTGMCFMYTRRVRSKKLTAGLVPIWIPLSRQSQDAGHIGNQKGRKKALLPLRTRGALRASICDDTGKFPFIQRVPQGGQGAPAGKAASRQHGPLPRTGPP